jgi:hypothetical protein
LLRIQETPPFQEGRCGLFAGFWAGAGDQGTGWIGIDDLNGWFGSGGFEGEFLRKGLNWMRVGLRVWGMSETKVGGEHILTGIWVSETGTVHTCWRGQDGATEGRDEAFCGFVWAKEGDAKAAPQGMQRVELSGKGPLNVLLESDDFGVFKGVLGRDALGSGGSASGPSRVSTC